MIQKTKTIGMGNLEVAEKMKMRMNYRFSSNCLKNQSQESTAQTA